jgi:hypothetical protein
MAQALERAAGLRRFPAEPIAGLVVVGAEAVGGIHRRSWSCAAIADGATTPAAPLTHIAAALATLGAEIRSGHVARDCPKADYMADLDVVWFRPHMAKRVGGGVILSPIRRKSVTRGD